MRMGHNIQHNINLCKGNSTVNSNMCHPDQTVENVQHVCAKACPKIIQHLTSNERKTDKSLECKQTGNFLTSPVLFSALQQNKHDGDYK